MSGSPIPESSPSPPRTSTSPADSPGAASDSQRTSATEFNPQFSSQSGSSESTSMPKGRKHSRQVQKWKSSMRKGQRNAGKGYVTKKGKEVSLLQFMRLL